MQFKSLFLVLAMVAAMIAVASARGPCRIAENELETKCSYFLNVYRTCSHCCNDHGCKISSQRFEDARCVCQAQ